MKFYTAILAAALTVSSAMASPSHMRRLEEQATTTKTTWVSKLTPIASTDAYHMKPVRALHVRVQAAAPAWDPTNKLFTSQSGATFEEKFRGSLDSANTASIEGALMAVQAEAINYNLRSNATQCQRKDDVKFVVFYDIVFAQTNETLALYEQEYGPYVSMSGGQCTSLGSKACQSINGDNGQPQIGPFVGRELKDADPRAPYPNASVYSFPNSAVTLKYANKTEALRNATRRGLCAFDKLPDGVTCTYNYRIAGWVPLDDVVGITKMRNKANTSTYKSFNEFCKDGRVEFRALTTNGSWQESIPFWVNPQDRTANARRVTKLVSSYKAMLSAKKSVQVESTLITNTMTALPTVKELTAQNPACYLNVKACGGQFGCKRSLYSQLCTVCTSAADTGCVVKPADFVYPTLAKAVAKTTAISDEDGGNGGGSKDGMVICVGIAGGMIAIVLAVLVAFRHQRRRVREPKLKTELLSPNTRANGPQVIEITTRLEKPVVAKTAAPTSEV